MGTIQRFGYKLNQVARRLSQGRHREGPCLWVGVRIVGSRPDCGFFGVAPMTKDDRVRRPLNHPTTPTNARTRSSGHGRCCSPPCVVPSPMAAPKTFLFSGVTSERGMLASASFKGQDLDRDQEDFFSLQKEKKKKKEDEDENENENDLKSIRSHLYQSYRLHGAADFGEALTAVLWTLPSRCSITSPFWCSRSPPGKPSSGSRNSSNSRRANP